MGLVQQSQATHELNCVKVSWRKYLWLGLKDLYCIDQSGSGATVLMDECMVGVEGALLWWEEHYAPESAHKSLMPEL